MKSNGMNNLIYSNNKIYFFHFLSKQLFFIYKQKRGVHTQNTSSSHNKINIFTGIAYNSVESETKFFFRESGVEKKSQSSNGRCGINKTVRFYYL